MSCHAIVQSLPHKQRVARLYRYGLRELLNYSANRQHWYPRAFALRAEFEANRAETSREEIRRQLEHGEALMSRFKHWEPLIRPEYPGGTAYSVNPSHPKNVHLLPNWDKLDGLKRGDWM
uniref:NADH dehydrogenase [ubiquinone] 1 beta subcomplex subunit 9 n=1 Tax=Dunaliella tertiolecta TaxID=3047 RepID=A0A7S3QKE1_DUNTE|mmetsp:Transcript_22649/g.62536  ORF Transcript_22649/g.62536 Transcript_22649/m.62536 type:complete len:120 (-) Transcript_22649:530-889(-)